MRIIHYEVSGEDEGRRVSRVVRARMQLSYHLYAQLKLRDGVLLDGVPVRANHIVRAGQSIAVCIDAPGSTAVAAEDGPVDILYCDQDLLVIDKPAPLPCQSSPKQPTGALENRLAHHFRDEPGFVFHPVNRLDKGTSGLMVVARHPHAQALLSRQLHSDEFVREYLAVVEGVPAPESGTIDAPIAKAPGPTIRREVRPDGKSAATHYALVQSHPGPLSLVRLILDSGRTHQIRVHMAYIGCPVFGDFLYGQESPLLPGRFALHSCRIAFNHPITHQQLIFSSPMPPAMQSLFS